MSHNPRIRDEALAIFHRQTRDLIMLCDFSGVTAWKVTAAAKYLEDLGPREGVVYLSQLFLRTRSEIGEVTSDDNGDNQN